MVQLSCTRRRTRRPCPLRFVQNRHFVQNLILVILFKIVTLSKISFWSFCSKSSPCPKSHFVQNRHFVQNLILVTLFKIVHLSKILCFLYVFKTRCSDRNENIGAIWHAAAYGHIRLYAATCSYIRVYTCIYGHTRP